MTKNDISEIKLLLGTPKNIVIVPHKNPDGDAMGSTLGLCHYLKQFGHNADVIAPNNYPEFLKWIPGDDQVIIYESEVALGNQKIENADIIFTLDFNALNRTGDMEMPLKNSSSLKILIDHHQQPDGYAKYQYSDVSMSSTSEMVYHFIDMLDDLDKINSEIATCLYVGIMTDTGSFRFSSTTSVTHNVIADLIDKGANNSQIHINVYDTSSYNRLQLLGRALNNLKVIPEFSTAYIVLAQEDLNEFNFKRGDTEGVVNYALSIKGVKFALIFIEQKKEGIIKISLRSKQGFDVNKFARAHFNGGGHINAAGGRSELSLSETTKLLHKLLPNYKEDLTI